MPLLTDYFTEKQLADELGISTRTIRRMRAKREGPPYVKLPGRVIVYNKTKALTWINSLEVAAIDKRSRAERRVRKRGKITPAENKALCIKFCADAFRMKQNGATIREIGEKYAPSRTPSQQRSLGAKMIRWALCTGKARVE